jgi:hypothetical protein
MPRLLTPAALLVIAAWGSLAGVSFAPAGPDTGREVYRRVRAGMTLEEVGRVIGVPPGDYRLEEDRTVSFFGETRGPQLTSWVSYRGRITVGDGDIYYAKPVLRLENPPDGVIESVWWSPAEQDPLWWRLRSPLAVAAALLAGGLLVAGGVRGWCRKQSGRGHVAVVPETARSS